MADWLLENWNWVLLVILTVVITVVVMRWVQGLLMKLRMLRTRRQGGSGEDQAVQYLTDIGFENIQLSNFSEHQFWVEDVPIQFSLRPDILAVYAGEKWLIEVKNGEESTISNRYTRRQILEYQVQYPEHQVAIYDATQGKLLKVEFR